MKPKAGLRTQRGCAYIVEGGEDVRGALDRLLKEAGIPTAAYASVEDFLVRCRVARPACAVVDVSLPGASAMQLQQMLLSTGVHLPLIFVTDRGDLRTAVQAVKKGAVDCIEKPFDRRRLITLIKRTLRHEEEQLANSQRYLQAMMSLQLLSQRERQVMELLVTGNVKDRIAKRLGISARTVASVRATLMEKLQANSVEDLSQILLMAKGFGRGKVL